MFQGRVFFILNLATNEIKQQIKPASLVMKNGVAVLDVDRYSKLKYLILDFLTDN